jgi:hypothetical protein
LFFSGISSLFEKSHAEYSLKMKYGFIIFLIFLVLRDSEQKTITCRVEGIKCRFTNETVLRNEAVFIKVEPARANISSITEVWFIDSSIYSIPPEIFDQFKNLNRLQMSQQNVRELDLEHLEKPRKLNIWS